MQSAVSRALGKRGADDHGHGGKHSASGSSLSVDDFSAGKIGRLYLRFYGFMKAPAIIVQIKQLLSGGLV